MASPNPKPLLLGIVMDISASMKDSWNNQKHRNRPRFDVVREALNKEIQRIRDLHALHPRNTHEIDMFCLGLGFRIPLQSLGEDFIGVYDPLNHAQKQPEHIEIVCDVLALSEITPTSHEISTIESRLNALWRSHSKTILEEAAIPDDVYERLQKYIRETLFTQGNTALDGSVLGRMYRRLTKQEIVKKNRLQRAIEQRFQGKKAYIETTSYAESHRYFNVMMDAAQAIFRQHQTHYVEYITKELKQFVAEQTEETLNYVSLGIDLVAALEHFNEAKAHSLAVIIYHYLETHVQEKIRWQWGQQAGRLWWVRWRLRAKIDFAQVKELTEHCIRKRTWELLEPLVRSIVHDLFDIQFRTQSKLMIPVWLELAAAREVIKPLNDIVQMFPDLYEDDLYSSTYIFGNTPMKQALERAALRFLDPTYQTSMKVMIIVTDGLFPSKHAQRITAHLKKQGVKIIGCYIHDQDVASTLARAPSKNWPDGAKLLLELSSEITQTDEFEQRFRQIVTPSSLGQRLFFQINHSEVFEKLLRLVLDDDTSR